MAAAVAPRLDPVLKLAQIELLDISPDQAHRMVLADQAVDIHRTQRDLVALRLAQPRRAERLRIGLRPRLRRQISKQFVGSHHRLPRIHHR